jgi:hypothetical protein
MLLDLYFHHHVRGEDSGSGYPIYPKKQRTKGPRFEDVLEKALSEFYEELTPKAKKKAEKIVSPYREKQKQTIDWQSLERNLAKAGELIELWQMEQVEEVDEEEIIVMYVLRRRKLAFMAIAQTFH